MFSYKQKINYNSLIIYWVKIGLTIQVTNAASSMTSISLTSQETGLSVKTWRHEGERFATMDLALKSTCLR